MLRRGVQTWTTVATRENDTRSRRFGVVPIPQRDAVPRRQLCRRAGAGASPLVERTPVPERRGGPRPRRAMVGAAHACDAGVFDVRLRRRHPQSLVDRTAAAGAVAGVGHRRLPGAARHLRRVLDAWRLPVLVLPARCRHVGILDRPGDAAIGPATLRRMGRPSGRRTIDCLAALVRLAPQVVPRRDTARRRGHFARARRGLFPGAPGVDRACARPVAGRPAGVDAGQRRGAAGHPHVVGPVLQRFAWRADAPRSHRDSGARDGTPRALHATTADTDVAHVDRAHRVCDTRASAAVARADEHAGVALATRTAGDAGPAHALATGARERQRSPRC